MKGKWHLFTGSLTGNQTEVSRLHAAEPCGPEMLDAFPQRRFIVWLMKAFRWA